MANYTQYNPNYKKLYPNTELRPDILAVLKQSDRKMKYTEIELKAERFIHSQETQTAIFHPSREDSYERMCEEDHAQFAAEDASPEEIAVRTDELQRLRSALLMLDRDETALIHALFYECTGERAYAKRIGISQKGVNKRRKRVLEKLRRILETK